MPLPAQIDPQDRREPLERWFAARLDPATEVRIEHIGNAPGAGFSNETLLLDAAWNHGGEARSGGFVVRVKPSNYNVFYRAPEFFESQYKLMKILAEKSAVPVPAIHWYEADSSWLGAPFLVMDKVAGNTLPDIPPYFISGWLHAASPRHQEQAWWSVVDAVARINTVDWQALGLDFLVDSGVKAGFDQRMSYYLEAFDWAREDTPSPIVEAARDWLLDNRPVEPEPVALCWGDARPGNIIYRDFEVAAVIDWEMASLGPPLQDLGWWFFMHRAFFGDLHTGDPAAPVGLPGFPSRERTIARWEQLTGFSGATFEFHEVFAGFRMAVHLQRMGKLFIDFGAVATGSTWASNNLATQALAPLIGVEHPEPAPMPAILQG